MEKINRWALILGASSGFGAATAIQLAKDGMNIFGVHLDLKATIAHAEEGIRQIQSQNVEAVFFNCNAAEESNMVEIVTAIEKKFEAIPGSTIQVLLHSLAFGSLKPFISENPAEEMPKGRMDTTIDVMANSLVYWVQKLVAKKLMSKGGRIFAMTSAGSSRVWKSYGAVSAAKAALESHIRQLALELAPLGITANAILAGVTDTPALRKIPGYEKMLEISLRKNPGGRSTVPEDIAKVISLFSREETGWMTGNTIRIDGGESIVE